MNKSTKPPREITAQGKRRAMIEEVDSYDEIDGPVFTGETLEDIDKIPLVKHRSPLDNERKKKI